MLDSLPCFYCHLLNFFEINIFKVKQLKNLDPDQDLIWVQTVCKDHQQTIKIAASKERFKINEVLQHLTMLWFDTVALEGYCSILTDT